MAAFVPVSVRQGVRHVSLGTRLVVFRLERGGDGRTLVPPSLFFLALHLARASSRYPRSSPSDERGWDGRASACAVHVLPSSVPYILVSFTVAVSLRRRTVAFFCALLAAQRRMCRGVPDVSNVSDLNELIERYR